MSESLTWVIKHGEKGTERTGTLFANGVPIDLTNKTVTMNARKDADSARVIEDAEIVPDTDQEANPGKISWTVLEAHSDPEAIPASSDGYLIEFKLVEQDVVDYVPKRHSELSTYGRLIVHKNLD
jgi:hypothetical protein